MQVEGGIPQNFWTNFGEFHLSFLRKQEEIFELLTMEENFRKMLLSFCLSSATSENVTIAKEVRFF